MSMFHPLQVAMISLGTLTFIKPAINKLRSTGLKSKVLQIPMEDAVGKSSYTKEVKKEIFSNYSDFEKIGGIPILRNHFFYIRKIRKISKFCIQLAKTYRIKNLDLLKRDNYFIIMLIIASGFF